MSFKNRFIVMKFGKILLSLCWDKGWIDNYLGPNQKGLLTCPNLPSILYRYKYNLNQIFISKGGRSPHVKMVKVLDCGLKVSKFKLQSHNYVHFHFNTLGKGMNPLIPPTPRYGLNSITAVLLQG